MTSGILNFFTLFKSLKTNTQPTFDAQPNNFLITRPINSQCCICIVIPVRDEAENLDKTLASVITQVDLTGCPLDPNSFEIIVLANNCRDNSAEIACERQKQNAAVRLHIAEINLPKKDANIGFARRLLMNEAYRRLSANDYGGGIIMTTDGDSQVAPDWIAATIAEFENGADAVGGRIEVHPAEFEKLDDKTRSFYRLDEHYRLLAAEFESRLDVAAHDPYPRHHQHFNGSFAVTTAAYQKAGGIPDVKCLEDVAFYNSLVRVDAKVRHSPKMRVFTSARNAGRTTLGLSTQLNEWQIMGRNNDVYFVESAESLEKRFIAQRDLRLIWQNFQTVKLTDYDGILAIAKILCVAAERLNDTLQISPTFGSLCEHISNEQAANGEWNLQNPLVAVEAAISVLEDKLEKLRPREKTLNKTA